MDLTNVDKDRGIDKRKVKRELAKFRKQVAENGGRLPGNEAENVAGGQKALAEAKAHKEQEKLNRQKEMEAWAKDQATTVARRMRNAVDVIGGFGEGKKSVCGGCGAIGGKMKGTWDKEKKEVVYECVACKKANVVDNKSYMKIICKW